jgi:hypothetical protein
VALKSLWSFCDELATCNIKSELKESACHSVFGIVYNLSINSFLNIESSVQFDLKPKNKSGFSTVKINKIPISFLLEIKLNISLVKARATVIIFKMQIKILFHLVKYYLIPVWSSQVFILVWFGLL